MCPTRIVFFTFRSLSITTSRPFRSPTRAYTMPLAHSTFSTFSSNSPVFSVFPSVVIRYTAKFVLSAT